MNSTELSNRLERLLSESIASVRDREEHDLDRRVGLDGDFALFGAGNLGRKVVKKLMGIGKAPIAFIDNNPALWGKEIEGVPVMSPAELARRCNPVNTGIVTTIWCGEATDRMSERIGPLTELGFRRIALFTHLAWKFPDAFLPHYSLDKPSKVIAQSARIIAAFELLSDDESRSLFVSHVEWRLFGDYDVLPLPAAEQIYFDERFANIDPSEVLYDIGAYTGDSVKSFLATPRGSHFSQIHSFEPSSRNFDHLRDYLASLPELNGKLFAHRLALGDCTGLIQVETEHGPASRVGRGADSVPMTTIDAFGASARPPTFIKIDIEGFEPQCLQGANETVSNSAPLIAVCVYHHQSHLWDIVLQLHAYQPSYGFRFVPHLADGWDLVLYAMPERRRPTFRSP